MIHLPLMEHQREGVVLGLSGEGKGSWDTHSFAYKTQGTSGDCVREEITLSSTLFTCGGVGICIQLLLRRGKKGGGGYGGVEW